MRNFKSGAIRSSDKGKIEYLGYRHPLIEKSFGEYMLGHQTQEDGNQREANNWWKGWDKGVSIQSLVRHTEDLQALYAGYDVWKVYSDKGEKTVYCKRGKVFNIPKGAKCIQISEEDCCNAIRFNAGSYLLDVFNNDLKYINL